MRRFEVIGDGTSKFWEIECVGAEGAPEWTAVLYTEELALEFPAKPPERSRA